ncbi:unnamed protein product [Mytilus coruscus]|uniref:Ig-like domain-containing protein n=1 Tax=Mytilus coruscus TaxID=42192 RepID=A0A6J8BQP6_MYTCO|nr:unnamed protein product [Mytilus coruscus]
MEEPVAIFSPDMAAMLLPSYDNLSGRVTLTNITKVSTNATMTFDNLECEDEKDYICTFNYVNVLGVVLIKKSEPTRIIVNAFPSLPDNISSVVIASIRIEKQDNSSANYPNSRKNISLSTNRNIKSSFYTLLTDTVTLTTLRSTEKSVPSFREGETVQFTCTGNIGKPPGRFVWQIIPQQEEPIVYYNETTFVDQIHAPDICSFRGTSNLTVQITADHFKAKVRCFEESQADVQGMFVETELLNVFCKYNKGFHLLQWEYRQIINLMEQVTNIIVRKYNTFLKNVAIPLVICYARSITQAIKKVELKINKKKDDTNKYISLPKSTHVRHLTTNNAQKYALS